MEPLGSHPVRHTLLAIHDVIMLPSERYLLDWWARFYYGFGWSRLHICWGMIWRHSIFPTCHTFDVILGHISALGRDLQILTFAWSSPVTRCMSGWRFCFISSWLPGGLSLGRFIRLTLSNVSVIFVWSHRAHGFSHHPFHRSTCQIFYASPSSYSWVSTLGHTPHSWVYQIFCGLSHYSIYFLIFVGRHTGAYPHPWFC